MLLVLMYYLLCTETPYGRDAQAPSLVGGGAMLMRLGHPVFGHPVLLIANRAAFLLEGKCGSHFPFLDSKVLIVILSLYQITL